MSLRKILTGTAIVAGALALGIAIAALVVIGPAEAKSPPVFTGIVKGVAVGGYDPVAYHTEGKAVAGSKDITLEHDGAVWRFASDANRAAFKADPGRYAPHYGGYCAWAVSRGYTAKGDPQAWSIVDGKLYLNYDKSVRSSWEKAARSNITKADANWPKVLAK
ncbi:MAG: YHS domain-containing (seleno)protein [Hyphomicrobiaceae bacterium]|nr:YHS domain-containing (seleno)protein [Hyphomicrobiaceae bacterium]